MSIIYWNSEIECMEAEERRKMQLKSLQKQVQHAYDNVPYYREKMKKQGILPGDIKTLDDLSKLPFTTKQDLRDNYPFSSFAVPMKDVVRVHASSGTTGKQTVVGYTQNDLNVWTESMARSLYSVDVTNKDMVHISYGYGLFTGGLGLHYGAEKVGASVVPASAGKTSMLIQLVRDFGATVIGCTPSYALHIADAMEEAGVKKEELKLKTGIMGAEPWSEEMRSEIEERLGIKAYDIYGLSEISGPGVSMDCVCRQGMHVQEDHFYPEIIDPDTCEVLKDGEEGELVFTCLTKEALPLIRYRTRDLTILNHEKCDCGRTNVRMRKVRGRSDDMLIIRGVNVFPSQIESALLKFAEVEPHYMIYVDRINNLDMMEIQVEMTPGFFSDEVRKIEALEKKLFAEIHAALNVSAKIKLVEPKSIKRSEGKAQRVIDKRKIF